MSENGIFSKAFWNTVLAGFLGTVMALFAGAFCALLFNTGRTNENKNEDQDVQISAIRENFTKELADIKTKMKEGKEEHPPVPYLPSSPPQQQSIQNLRDVEAELSQGLDKEIFRQKEYYGK